MHELSIMRNIVRICEESAAGFPIKKVTVEVGELSGIIPSALEFCFEASVKGTLLENAKMIINVISPQVRCKDCETMFNAKAYYDSCPECKSSNIEVLLGEELKVKELEVY